MPGSYVVQVHRVDPEFLHDPLPPPSSQRTRLGKLEQQFRAELLARRDSAGPERRPSDFLFDSLAQLWTKLLATAEVTMEARALCRRKPQQYSRGVSHAGPLS